MGLTLSSTGAAALGLSPEGRTGPVIALAGNPNVGKSTVFNHLTGMNQHTGNWPGKTVTTAQGICRRRGRDYLIVDLPGTYSLQAHSAEEEVARDFLCFGAPDAAVVVCDASCLERNLNLVLQILEVTRKVVVCVNLMDEARRHHIELDLPALEQELGVPVVGASARSGEGMDLLMDRVARLLEEPSPGETYAVPCPEPIEGAVSRLIPLLEPLCGDLLPARWAALRLLEENEPMLRGAEQLLGVRFEENEALVSALAGEKSALAAEGLSPEKCSDAMVRALVREAERLCAGKISAPDNYGERDRKIDRLLTSRLTGIPLMLALLSLIFWITITGANYPSRLLSDALFAFQDQLTLAFRFLGAPEWLHGMLVLGVYRVLAWVVAVMLPPMAIFFPLFTLLEDLGYLPRVAFNLDHCFQKCRACGKQALTMCMGFGCNAAGIVGTRIIDSPRERLIAILTNNFVPCNGRFPTLIAIISMFFVGSSAGLAASVQSTLLLTGVILLGVLMTFWVSRLLSGTLLRGVPSSFTLELPPYRPPQIGRVIVRSIFDRTLFVLGRAVVVAAPAGLLIWALANITVDGGTLLSLCCRWLDPFARLLGLDGVILMAFLLGFPANEIVVPIMLMGYLSTGSLLELEDLTALRALLVENGWTWVTAVCTMLFSLMHWPCSTACLTIFRETGSRKWTLLSILIPTAIGMTVCFLFHTAAVFLGLV